MMDLTSDLDLPPEVDVKKTIRSQETSPYSIHTKTMVTFQDIADELDMELERVRNILTEDPDTIVSEDVKDKVFQTARDLGYDFSKLKIGKRMRLRKKILSDLENEIRDHPEWSRQDIVDHLIRAQEMVDRVTNRAFQDEFETSGLMQAESESGSTDSDSSSS